MKVSVIIVSYNFEQWIDRCLGSLRRSTFPVSVIVVDNGSKDNTTQIIERKYPEVHLIKTGVNLGFGKANNIGIRCAMERGADYFFLLNQDAWISEKTIKTLLDLFEEHPKYGILSPTHLNGKGDKLDFGFSTYSGMNEKEEFFTMQKDHEVVTLKFINAAFWMISVQTIKKVGGFSPLFYHYGEDIDYINRLHYHGLQLGYSPRVFGYHDRESREVSRAGFLRSERVYLLSEYANINYTFTKAFGYGVLAGIKKAMQALVKGKIANCFAFINISFGLLWKTKHILHIRNKNKKEALNYI
ncbi:glycosyltransferase family 2 protein [uncultured Bacteroides sp.]|uniref:glycosyltransferase family 2 protein n=1 Tax=uncultured Bacteroides sp. TaxID=162156 RepID=UPI002AA8E414|nr:glycosyltransferase family 2 protein [uncultured Bacteroides sp.]